MRKLSYLFCKYIREISHFFAKMNLAKNWKNDAKFRENSFKSSALEVLFYNNFCEIFLSNFGSLAYPPE